MLQVFDQHVIGPTWASLGVGVPLTIEMGAGALAVVGLHIGIGEGGLALRAHEAELEAGAGIGGQPTERRQVGDDRVRPVHQLLVDGADGEPQLPLAVGPRE